MDTFKVTSSVRIGLAKRVGHASSTGGTLCASGLDASVPALRTGTGSADQLRSAVKGCFTSIYDASSAHSRSLSNTLQKQEVAGSLLFSS